MALADRDPEVPGLSLIEPHRYREIRRQGCLLRVVICLLVCSLGSVITAFGFLLHQQDSNQVNMKHPGVATEEGPTGEFRADWTYPNAHLTALSNYSILSKYFPWEHKRGDAYLELFSYDKEKQALIVPQKGRYYIYLQVTYRMPSEFPCQPNEVLYLQQTVFLWSDSYRQDRVLMKAKDYGCCKNCPWVKPVHITGVYSLDAGDRLMVQVSQQSLIEMHEKSVYFGAFFISKEKDA